MANPILSSIGFIMQQSKDNKVDLGVAAAQIRDAVSKGEIVGIDKGSIDKAEKFIHDNYKDCVKAFESGDLTGLEVSE